MDLPDHPHTRRSNSSHSTATSNSHTPPSSWAASGKLVRKKASGLFRDAARSWGRSKSKEVLSLGLGALIPNSPTTRNQSDELVPAVQSPSTTTTTSNLKTTTTLNPIGPIQPSTKKLRPKHQHQLSLNPRSEIGFGDWADTLNTAVASSSPSSPLSSSRPDHEPRSRRLPDLDPSMTCLSSTTSAAVATNPSNRARRSPLTDTFTSPGKRPEPSHASASLPSRNRLSSHARVSILPTPSNQPEPVSSFLSSRVPRSTFPHVPRSPRSPRSPRRSYNTRATSQRSSAAFQSQQDYLNLTAVTTPHPSLKPKLTPNDGARASLSEYQDPAPMTSSPFKRSMSPISHFNGQYDLDSPVASKSTGHHFISSASKPPIIPTPVVVSAPNALPPSPSKFRGLNSSSSLRLRSAGSARANLFGAKPNMSAGYEPFSAPPIQSPTDYSSLAASESSISSLVGSTGCTNAQSTPTWLNSPLIHPGDPSPCSAFNSRTTAPPRSRQRTVSVTLKEHPNRASSYGLGPLPEDDQDSDHNSDDLESPYAFNHSSPSSRSCNGMVRIDGSGSPIAGPIRRASAGSVKGCSTLSRRDGSSASNHRPNSATNNSLGLHSGSASSRHSTRTLRDREVSAESFVVPQLESLGMTPRRRSFDESCEDTDADERATQAGSSKPSSSNSILSVSRRPSASQDPFRTVSSVGSHSFLKSPGPGFDGFGALPPPESPFPGHHRSSQHMPFRSPTAGLPASPNKLKRDNEGALVITSLPTAQARPRPGFHSQPIHHLRPRADSLTPLKRDSWGHRSLDASEDDDYHDHEMIAHHDRDHLNGSLESHEGLSNLSVPGLTDSSSLASSLASSNQSLAPAHYHDGSGGAYRSASWEKTEGEAGREAKRRSLPTSVVTPQSFSHLPPSPFPPVAHSTHNQSSFFSNPPLKPLFTAPTCLASTTTSAVEQEGTSFHSIKPEASAFLSSGMMPKKVSILERRRQQLGTPSPFVQYTLPPPPGPSDEEVLAFRVMRAALGGPKVIEAAIRADEKEQARQLEISNRSISFSHSSIGIAGGSPFLSAELLGGGRRPSLSSLRMPDTPIKKPTFVHKALSTAAHQHHTKPFVSSGLSRQAIALDDSPSSSRNIPHPPIASTSNKVFSRDSPSNSPKMGSPSALAAFKKSPLFRRRSSDAVLSSSERSGRVFVEDLDPGTPTKVAPGWICRGSQLLTSPGNSNSSAASSPVFPPAFAIHRPAQQPSVVPDFLTDAQVTPSRPNGRLFSTFQPLAVSSPSRRPGFMSRHSSGEIRGREEGRNRLEMEFDVLQTIGSGEFGEVFKARHAASGIVYAIKRAKKPVGGPKALSRQMEEVELLRTLNSPYIIRLHDAWQHAYHLHIQTEYCPNGTLQTFLDLAASSLPGRLDEERIWKILAELAQAVAFIHQHGILHLDLKPANVFVSAHGGLKVGDFGLAVRWPRIDPREAFREPSNALVAGRYPVYCYAGPEPQGAPRQFLRYVDIADADERSWARLKPCGRFVKFDLEREGDREYIAPETLSGRYGEPADVFALGLIGLEMATEVDLPDNGDEWRGLRSNDLSTLDLAGLSGELVVLLRRILERCPDKRLTAEELVEHPVIVKLGELRARGLTAEARGELEIGESGIEDDGQGDTEMNEGSNEEEEEKWPTVARPKAPIDGLWTVARGALLPEAKGFLDFILTGEPTPQRVRRQLRRQRQRRVVEAESSDQMDLDEV
ncbi:hypothetical protein CROQUDRAFT_89950 [Cronartium quercuum f. sp. fusiforme G11]|uniref:Protein kinase domain-containing protein n=1 Tax=Cronartium quercuum f. sp. fusiforme G11 TaxID=708437 RepID=A0A9P6NMJ3_9BASI|nr:hypothetical protein CROQUDRAFT_89950 [Cronartium quercuum f. sp. fusiforme G11]